MVEGPVEARSGRRAGGADGLGRSDVLPTSREPEVRVLVATAGGLTVPGGPGPGQTAEGVHDGQTTTMGFPADRSERL